ADLKRLRRDTDSGRTVTTLSPEVSEAVSAGVARADSGPSGSRQQLASAVPVNTSAIGSGSAPVAGLGRNKMIAAAVAVALVVVGAVYAAYHFGAGSRVPGAPAKLTQISRWDKIMTAPRLSPDGHTVAFSSPVAGIEQVFVMLTSGGEPLQLTSDEGVKIVRSFSPDGTEIFYRRQFGREEIWGVPTLGGTPSRFISGDLLTFSPDGSSVFFTRRDVRGLFRADRS